MKKLPLSNVLEQNIRKAIDETPGINQVSESQYADAVLEALDILICGFEMRRQELRDREEE